MKELAPLSERIPNRKHRLFIDELFKQNQNATKAYQTVYDCAYDTARNNGPRLLAIACIQEEVQYRLAQSAMSANEVLQRLGEHARGDYTQYIDNNGYVDIEAMERDGKKHLIQGIRWGKDGQMIVEFPNSQSALVHIGKAYSLFTDKVEHSGSIESKLVILPAQEDDSD